MGLENIYGGRKRFEVEVGTLGLNMIYTRYIFCVGIYFRASVRAVGLYIPNLMHTFRACGTGIEVCVTPFRSAYL